MVAVHDGDTLSVRTAAAVVRVRLVGIDCPEQGQRFSRRARRFTARQVSGRVVLVLGGGRDQYDRLLARVLVDGRDLNEALVRAGLAWHYETDAPGLVLEAAEREARAARRGLWSDPDPVPPWAWRRTHARDGQRRPPARATPTSPSDPAGPLRGNARSRVFHRPGCPNYRCRNCTEQFLTEASALEAGYRPAGDCHRR
ncbi:MAG TPA: thermonuclease family protein [Methylomirabilota bacterium]